MPSPGDTAARRLRRKLVAVLGSALVGALVVASVSLGFNPLSLASSKTTLPTGPNPATPGTFTGYGFDQCEAPSQTTMSAWLKSSPFRAAGIYISGALRFCQKQTNLTPTWVATQLAAGWHLLPIHLGAQASCNSVTRYKGDLINADPTDSYSAARAQGRAEANTAAAAAAALGIVEKSTIFYDLESFSTKSASCKTSALMFLQAWTNQLHAKGYASGVYSSAGSGIKVLDDARATPGNKIVMPDQVWIADWNGKATTTSTYIRSDGWPGRRVHQYQGGHDETWGGVTVNIDRSYMSLTSNAYTPPPIVTPEGAKLVDPRCTTAAINRTAYRFTSRKNQHTLALPLQCLLKEHGLYVRSISAVWNPKTTLAVEAWQRKVHHKVQAGFTRADWVSLLAAGNTGTVLKPGVRGADVIRAQRALNAATSSKVPITGVYDLTTQTVASTYQKENRISPTQGIIASLTWAALSSGKW
ncbi:MAG TPA: glycoside hydrolase domain-containing protein [Marmoricola sp.]|nr:glycoside hydrolase domain-containing protein [Marmoricola sp.]